MALFAYSGARTCAMRGCGPLLTRKLGEPIPLYLCAKFVPLTARLARRCPLAPPRALTGVWFMVQKKEAIEPMMSVIEQVCTLIDTTDDVFSFKVRCARHVGWSGGARAYPPARLPFGAWHVTFPKGVV